MQQNNSGILLERENKTLWNFIEIVMPYLENNDDYIKFCQENTFNLAIHRQTESVLRQKKHDKEMERYSKQVTE